MDGFYSIWTEPFKIKHKDTDFFISDYDMLTVILSAAVYKKNNGKVALYGDKDGLSFFVKNGFEDLFDDGLTEIKPPQKINPKVFWAGGKIESLKSLKKSAVMIDLDLIIWKNLDEFFKGADIYGIHRENIRPEIYPDLSFFRMKKNYKFPEGLDKEALPLNTAMLYIKDLDYTHKYADESLRFMTGCSEENENLKHMVFAEQRLLPMMASRDGKIIKTMFPLGEDIGIQDYFTHIWGHKNILRYNSDERKKYCCRIIKRLMNDYPDHMKFVEGKDMFSEYINGLG